MSFQLRRGGGFNRAQNNLGGGLGKRAQLTRPIISVGAKGYLHVYLCICAVGAFACGDGNGHAGEQVWTGSDTDTASTEVERDRSVCDAWGAPRDALGLEEMSDSGSSRDTETGRIGMCYHRQQESGVFEFCLHV